MSYLEELLPEFRKGAKIRRRSWENSWYIYYDNEKNGIFDQDGKCDVLCSWFIMDCEWELYQEPIDWDYIIKNKCLCLFWNSDNDNKEYGLLGKIYDNLSKGDYRFYKKFEQHFRRCRPVRRDEVTFYEDKKDEQD